MHKYNMIVYVCITHDVSCMMYYVYIMNMYLRMYIRTI